MDITMEDIVTHINLLELSRKITFEDRDLNLSDLGMDSLEFVKLIVLLEEEFHITALENTLVSVMGHITVNNICEALCRACE